MDETDPLLKVSHPAAGNPGGELLKEKLLKENSSLVKSRQAKGKSFVVAVGCLLVVFLIFIPLITQQKGIYTLSVLGNEDYGLPPAMFDYPWATSHLAVVEPYRLTTIKANNGCEKSCDWYIDGEKVQSVSGSRLKYMFRKVGTSKLVVTNGGAMRIEASLAIRYIRREIRDLTESDRVAFFDAMGKIWNVSSTVGQKLFKSSDYIGMDELDRIHAVEAGYDKSCDHWHGGMGFLPQHVVLSIVFEKSLQAVNPAVSLPFYDFVRDGQWILDERGGNVSAIAEATIFQDDWFGFVPADGGKTQQIANGRWASINITRNIWSDANEYSNASRVVHNSYGLLRSPWNNNNLLHISRSMASVCGASPLTHPIPSCATYARLFELPSWAQFAWEAPTKGHGALHVNIGGAFGSTCAVTFDALAATGLYESELLGKLRLEVYHIMASLYRSGLCALDGADDHLVCPSFCTLDTPIEDCVCECKDARADHFNFSNLVPCMAPNEKTRAEISALSLEAQEGLVRAICTSGAVMGENEESASPADPVFWVLHPTVERLWQNKKLSSTPFENESWPSTGTSLYGDDCPGHREFDTVAFVNLIPGNTVPFTLGEVMTVMDPRSGTLPYIYEDLSWRGQCEAAGYAFGL